jgi:hypothetical protein
MASEYMGILQEEEKNRVKEKERLEKIADFKANHRDETIKVYEDAIEIIKGFSLLSREE